MDSPIVPQKKVKTSTILTWLLLASAIFSCSARADYNILLVFLILLLKSHRTDKFKMFLKVVIHILVLTIFLDFLWIWQYTSYWRHGEETSDLWKSLSFVHNLTYYLGIFEFLLKLSIILFLYKQFSDIGGHPKELLSINYAPNKL